MTKKAKVSSGQMPLFDWVREAAKLTQQAESPAKGNLDIDSEFRAAVSDDLKAAQDGAGRELSRYQVAAKMSEFLGCEITKSMLDNWTAEAHEKHRFPAQYIPAFVIATGGQRRTFELLSRKSGLFALPGPDALRAEIQQLDEIMKNASREKQKRMLYLKEINGKGGK